MLVAEIVSDLLMWRDHLRRFARVNENHVSAVTMLEVGVAFDMSLPLLQER